MQFNYSPLLVIVALNALYACAPPSTKSPSTVADSEAALVIAKRLRAGSSLQGYPPFDKWNAHLEGGNWQVHATNQPTYMGLSLRTAELYVQIPQNGSTPGHCGVVIHD
jgi:hypothetical protein